MIRPTRSQYRILKKITEKMKKWKRILRMKIYSLRLEIFQIKKKKEKEVGTQEDQLVIMI